MSARESIECPVTVAISAPGTACKPVRFRAPANQPPSRVNLLLVVQFDSQDLPVTVSGEYAPMLPSNPWLYTGGDPIRGGRVIAWAAAPVVTEQEIEDATAQE